MQKSQACEIFLTSRLRCRLLIEFRDPNFRSLQIRRLSREIRATVRVEISHIAKGPRWAIHRWFDLSAFVPLVERSDGNVVGGTPHGGIKRRSPLQIVCLPVRSVNVWGHTVWDRPFVNIPRSHGRSP